jgi:hypothetical protein
MVKYDFVAGQYYKTRSGVKAYIDEVDPRYMYYPCHGYIWDRDGNITEARWTAEGFYLSRIAMPCSFDLIALWPEQGGPPDLSPLRKKI